MKYRTVIIDDEPLALQRLQRLLSPHQAVIEIIGEATSGPEAVQKIDALKPDLIFLDVQMPEMNGFEVLNSISQSPLIIFSTAYDQYALKAFETNSIDYLLKPINPTRLEKAIDKLQRLTHDDIRDIKTQLEAVVRSLGNPSDKRIQVRVGDKIRLLNVKDICFLKADQKYVAVHTHSESYLINSSLNQLEQSLPSEDFLRVHRSAIINLNHLDEIVRHLGGNYRVRMGDKNRTELPLSRNSRKKLSLG